MTHAPTLLHAYRAVRATTESLLEGLSPEDCQVQSMPDASPVKWHLAHTTWFFETLLLQPHVPGFRPFNPDWCFLFNSYYEALGPRHPRPQRGLLTRPTLAEVLAWRRLVDEQVQAAIAGGLDDAARDILVLGLHHEQQHQELILTDVQHHLSRNPLQPAMRPRELPRAHQSRSMDWIEHDGGVVEIGYAGGGFAFDNEGPRHRVFLQPFALAARPVTSGEFIAFIEDGGYRRPDLWLSDGWATVKAEGWDMPLYWERCSGAYGRFSLHGMVPIDPDAPVVHVSAYEADACARWLGGRMPTEAEWETIAAPRFAGELAAGQFSDEGLFVPTAPAPGNTGLFGGVWEWTSSAYSAYPGFRPTPGVAAEYNGKFMCNQLVLRGGSCLSPRNHLRPTYRNFWYPKDRFQATGFRIAR